MLKSLLNKASLLLIAIILATSCTSQKHNNATLEKNNDQKISQMIIIGETTKDDVVSQFGKPETVKTNKNGRIVWIYMNDRTNVNLRNIIPVTRALLGTKGKEKKLVITFDKNIVHNYQLTTEDVKTKQGLLDM